MKYALPVSLGLALVATTAPATAPGAIATAIERHRPTSWFTPEQKAFIQAHCGVDPDRHDRNLNINGATMICPDERTVTDPQVKIISADISRRVDAYTRDVMKQADVQRAIAATARDGARKAIAQADVDARVAEAMARADAARTAGAAARRAVAEAHVERQVRQAMAQVQIGRRAAERARDALADAEAHDTH